MRNDTLTRGIIVGSIIGASIGGMMSKSPTFRWRRRVMKAGKNFLRRNGVADMISDMF